MISQECIPVGCVPVARWPYAGVCFPGGCLLRGISALGDCLLGGGCLLPGGVCSRGCLLLGGVCSWGGVSAPRGCLLQGVSALGVVSQHALRQTPPLLTESQTPVKTLPLPIFVAVGKKAEGSPDWRSLAVKQLDQMLESNSQRVHLGWLGKSVWDDTKSLNGKKLTVSHPT